MSSSPTAAGRHRAAGRCRECTDGPIAPRLEAGPVERVRRRPIAVRRRGRADEHVHVGERRPALRRNCRIATSAMPRGWETSAARSNVPVGDDRGAHTLVAQALERELEAISPARRAPSRVSPAERAGKLYPAAICTGGRVLTDAAAPSETMDRLVPARGRPPTETSGRAARAVENRSRIACGTAPTRRELLAAESAHGRAPDRNRGRSRRGTGIFVRRRRGRTAARSRVLRVRAQPRCINACQTAADVLWVDPHSTRYRHPELIARGV